MAERGSGKKKDRQQYLLLNQDLKARSYRPFYLLYGEESYLKTSYKKSFREAFGGKDGMNYSYFEGNVELDELLSVLETLPFLAEGRLVILEDSGFCRHSAPERLCSYLPRMPKSSHLMLIEKEVDKRNRLYKLLDQGGLCCEMAEQDERALSAWAARILKKEGKRIRPAAMALLLERTGKSMEHILTELQKLSAYLGERELVEEEDLDAILSQNAEDRVFEMLSELGRGNRAGALRCYRELLAREEAPMKILALFRRSFNQLLLARECVEKGRNERESAGILGLKPYIAGKLMAQARHSTTQDLKERLARCLRYDAAIKSGKLSDRMAVELLLLS